MFKNVISLRNFWPKYNYWLFCKIYCCENTY